MTLLFQLPGNLVKGVPALVVERVKDGERACRCVLRGLDSCRRFHNEGDICPFQAQHGRRSMAGNALDSLIVIPSSETTDLLQFHACLLGKTGS